MDNSFTAAADAPICRTVKGQTYSFPVLKRRQLGELLAKWAAEDRAALLVRMNEVKADSKDRLDRLSDFDHTSKMIVYLYRNIFQFGRAEEILSASNPSVVIDDLPFTPDEIVDIALSVAGYDRLEVGEEEAKDDSKKKGSVNGS